MSKIFTILSGLLFFGLLSSCIFTPLAFDEKKWAETVNNTEIKDLYTDNINNGVFYNPWLAQEDRSFSRFLRWRFSKTPTYTDEAVKNKPQFFPDLIERITALPDKQDFISWIGHATFLIRLDDQYWLTDPIFSKRALLPKRITPPALIAEDLTGLNGKLNVMISHNHYDHLDKASLEALPENTNYFVPKGLKEYVESFVSGSVTEMNWWEELQLGKDTALTCLPAQHWSRRIFQGYNTTLWASYMLSSNGRTIYFAGDSGYFKGYQEIGRKFDTIDYALMPITAYDPRWFMHYPHMDTKEAIRAFQDIGARYFIPTQWGTFHLGDNPPGLPALDLHRDINEMQLDRSQYLVLNIGEIRML